MTTPDVEYTVALSFPEVPQLNTELKADSKQDAAILIVQFINDAIVSEFGHDRVTFPEKIGTFSDTELNITVLVDDQPYCNMHAFPSKGGTVKYVSEVDKQAARTMLQKVLTRDSIVEGTLLVIDDIYTGKWSRREPAGHGFTVGDVRDIKGWWQLKWLINEFVGFWIARTSRLFLQNRMGWTDRDFREHLGFITTMSTETDAMQAECVPLVIEAAQKKYGIKPVDIVKSRALKQKLVQFLKSQGLSIEDDNQYD